MPGLVAAGLVLAAFAFVTGALHEDGLADTADGFGGGRDREAKLAIMRDSRTGAYGVLALVLGILIKAAALAALAHGPWFLPVAILAGSGAFSRALIVWFMASTPPARSDGLAYQAGQPSDFTARRALVAGGVIAFALILWASGFISALIVVAAGGALAWALRRLALAQVGGHTGDIAGAMQFVSETAMIAAASAIIP
jgi:adenosylcobinamide-GDP ribazoletransferase